MQTFYTCKFDNHYGEAIIGYCLNEKCKLPPQCCWQCLEDKHKNHLEDCKNFYQTQNIIHQQIEEKKILENNLVQLKETIRIYIDKILQKTRLNLRKLWESDAKLEKQLYYEFKENIEYVKFDYYINKFSQKSEIIKIVDVVNKFKSVCDKLEEIRIKNIKQAGNGLLQANMLFQEGNTLQRQQKDLEAIDCYNEAIQLDPKNYNLYCNKGRIRNYKGNALRNLSKYDEALICYDEAIELDPKNVKAYENKGIALYNLNRYNKAIRCYDEAISLDPQKFSLYCNKGSALEDLQLYEEAIKCYDQAILLDPKNVTVYENKGLALEYLKEYKKAIECYEMAIQNGGQIEKLLEWISSIC